MSNPGDEMTSDINYHARMNDGKVVIEPTENQSGLHHFDEADFKNLTANLPEGLDGTQIDVPTRDGRRSTISLRTKFADDKEAKNYFNKLYDYLMGMCAGGMEPENDLERYMKGSEVATMIEGAPVVYSTAGKAIPFSKELETFKYNENKRLTIMGSVCAPAITVQIRNRKNGRTDVYHWNKFTERFIPGQKGIKTDERGKFRLSV